MNSPEVIVFAVSDSLRYDVCYPDIHTSMPYLAEHSTHFHEARSPACWTLPSHVSMFTGRWPHEHKANTQMRKVNHPYPFIAELMKEQGYYTLMITTNIVVTDIFDVNRGFDETIKVWKDIPNQDSKWFYSMLGFLWRPRFREKFFKSFVDRKLQNDIEGLRTMFRGYAPDIIEMVKERIDTLMDEGKQKLFVFLNFYDTHFPYQTRDKFTLESKGFSKFSEFSQLMQIINNSHLKKYDYKPNMKIIGHIKERQKRAFTRVAPLYDSLASSVREKVPNSTFIFTADHGENFGEEQALYHFANVTEGGNKVPLLWSRPGQTGRKDINHPVNIRNIFDSLCNEADIKTESPSWHMTEDPDKSLSVIQAYWYDANGKTIPLFKNNQFAFNTTDQKYVFRHNRWHEAQLNKDSVTRELPLCKNDNPIEEAHLPQDRKRELESIWKEYQDFEQQVLPR